MEVSLSNEGFDIFILKVLKNTSLFKVHFLDKEVDGILIIKYIKLKAKRRRGAPILTDSLEYVCDF
jgi:hypothetical protein